MQQSFAEFCKRPENRPAVEEAQRQEMKQALRLKESMQWLEFEKKVRLAINNPIGCEHERDFQNS